MIKEEIGTRRSVFLRNFATEVKSTALDLFGMYGLREESFYNTEEGGKLRDVALPDINKTPVELWIEVGEGMRGIYWHIWRDKYRQFYINNVAPVNGLLIAADVRHFNEIEIADLKFKLVNPRVPRRSGKSIDDILETYGQWTQIISNDGTLGDLRLTAQRLIKEYNLAADQN